MATRSRKLSGSAGALLRYFEELRARVLELYYSPFGRRTPDDPGDIVFDEVWGTAAKRLGLESLTRAQFAELCEGRWNGEQLVHDGHRTVVDRKTREQRTERVRTTMIDVVWAAPKSVMEFLIANAHDEELRENVIADFTASVKVAFDNMEEHAAVARVPVQTPRQRGRATVQHGPRAGQESKMQGSRTTRVPAELLATAVVQLSARPTDETIARGSPPDPHLHMHTSVMGICWVPGDADPATARTYTPDEQGIRRQAAERHAVFIGEFARRLEDRGVPLEYGCDRNGNITWEVAQSNPVVRRFFSTNGEHAHALRRKFEGQHGRSPTEEELTRLRDATRHRKDADAKQVDRFGAWERWRADVRLEGLRMTPPELVPGGVPRIGADERETELRRRLLRPAGQKGLTRDDAVFTREEMRAAIARCAVGLGFTAGDLARIGGDLVRDELVLVLGARDPRFDRFTTVQVVEQEVAISRGIDRRAQRRNPSPSRSAITEAIAKSRVPLDEEQRAAVAHMCARDAWAMLEGEAGTGKTATLKAVVDAYRDTAGGGRPAAGTVVVLSTSAATAERTGRPLDADRTWPIDAFVTAVTQDAFRPTSRTLILIDEAAMTDTPRMAALLDVAGEATIRAIGDPQQLAPIGPGGWYTDAARRYGVHELTRVYRQQDERDVDAYRGVRRGAAAQALEDLQERGRVHIEEDRSHAIQRAVEMYRDHRDAGRSESDVVIVVDGSNHEVDTINRLVQRERAQSEEITGPGIEVRATDTNRRWTLHEDDLVIFLEKYERHPRDAALPRGETRQRRVDNGETGIIAGIDTERTRALVALDRGSVVTVDLEEHALRQPLGLAYGVHVAKYQGGEAPIAIVLPSMGTASQNSGYTQLTRASVEAHVIVDTGTHGERPVETLARVWSEPATKHTAVSQLDPEVVRHVLARAGARAREEATARRWWAAAREHRRREQPVPEPGPAAGAPRPPGESAPPDQEPGPEPGPEPVQPVPAGARRQDPAPPRREPREEERAEVAADELLVDTRVDLPPSESAAGTQPEEHGTGRDHTAQPSRPQHRRRTTPRTSAEPARKRPATARRRDATSTGGRAGDPSADAGDEATLDPRSVWKDLTAQERYEAETERTRARLQGRAPPPRRRAPPAQAAQQDGSAAAAAVSAADDAQAAAAKKRLREAAWRLAQQQPPPPDRSGP